MAVSLEDCLVIGISSRALFDLDEENRIYEEEGLKAYADYQIAHEDTILKPGSGFAAGRIYTNAIQDFDPMQEIEQIRIAFDGDAVLFSDEAERIFQEKGLAAFVENEQKKALQQLPAGPFARFLKTISDLQNHMDSTQSPIRTALVTARNAPAHERVIRTLRAWDVRIDEAFFLGGITKKDVLKAFAPHIFFDDQKVHADVASQVVPSAQVPWKE